MTGGCLRSAFGPSCPGWLGLLLAGLLLMGPLVTAQSNTNDGVCTEEIIPDTDLNITWSSKEPNSVDEKLWCPQVSDSTPYIQYTVTNGSAGVWGLKIIQMHLVNVSSFLDYASKYNASLQRYSGGDWYTVITNGSVVTKNETARIYWRTKFTYPQPFHGLRLFPIKPLQAGGKLCMKISLKGCRVVNLCKNVQCGSHGKCGGVDTCTCDTGYYGATCSKSAYQIVRTIYRLVWTMVSETKVSTGIAQFTCSRQSGFTIEGTRLTLTGSRSFLYTSASSLTGDFAYLANPDGCRSLSVSFTYALRAFSSSVIGLFGTDVLQQQKGVCVWLSRSSAQQGAYYYLHVEVRRGNQLWSLKTRADAIQVLNVWTRLEISWSLTSGLVLYVQGREVGRNVIARSVTSLSQASYLVIGYPGYSYSADYEVSLLVREFTVSPLIRRQTLQAFKEVCPTQCINSGLCSGKQNCTCLGSYFGPRCLYTERGYAWSILSRQGNTLRTSLGECTLQGQGNLTITGNAFSLSGTNTYLAIASSALTSSWKCLLDPSRYSAFTVALRFSVQSTASTQYILGGSVGTSWTGVNVVLNTSLHLSVQVRLQTTQYEITYMFANADQLKPEVLVEVSFGSRGLILAVNGKAAGQQTTPTSTTTLSISTSALVLGAPKENPTTSNAAFTFLGMFLWTKSRDEITKVEGIGEAVVNISTPDGLNTTSTPDGLNTTSTPDGLNTTSTPGGLNTTSTPGGLTTTSTPGGLTTTSTPGGLTTTSTPGGVTTTSTPGGVTTTSTPGGVTTTSTPGGGKDSGCSVKTFTSLEKTAINLTLSLLTKDAANRAVQCRLLKNTTAWAERHVQTCWESAEAKDDSSSAGAFIKYVKTEELQAFKSMTTLLCAGTVPAEKSDGCDLMAIETQLTTFFDLSAEYGKGSYRCSLLWTSRDRVLDKVMGCSDGTQSVLSVLKAQVNSMSSMACMPRTCNVDFARTCLNFARRSLSSITAAASGSTSASQQVCKDLKLSLACATNHTVDCNGPTYNMLYEHVAYLRARYQQHCNVTAVAPPPSGTSCTGRISAADAQWMLHTAAHTQLFPKEVVCSFAHRKEWFGKDPMSSPLIKASSVLTDLCIGKPKDPVSCACDQTVVNDVKQMTDQLVSFALSQTKPNCTATEASIAALFGRMSGCDGAFKFAKAAELEQPFSQVCSKALNKSRLVCPTVCNISACESSVCGDIAECLAQTTVGCDTQKVLDITLYYQAKREKCSLQNDSGIQLTHRPDLNGVLRCMKTFSFSWKEDENIPMGRYCNILKGLDTCLETLEKQEEASKDRLGFKPAKHSRKVVKMISATLCDFLPKTACGAGTKADVAFLLDTSGSIGTANMKLLLKFVEDVLNQWDIDQQKIRVGAIRFATTASIGFFLNSFSSKPEVLEAIGKIPSSSGLTYTNKALDLMTDTLFTKDKGDRKGVPDYAIVITDGKSTNEKLTLAAAERAKKRGIKILAVGIGKGVDMQELKNMASPPSAENVFSISNFSQLAEVQSDFLQQACSFISNFQLPFISSEDGQCANLNKNLKEVQSSFLQLARSPYYSADVWQQMCKSPPKMPDLSSCTGEEGKYLRKVYEKLIDSVRQLCGLREAETGCNAQAASQCLLKLANSFILPAESACTLYSQVEVCVKENTLQCPEAVAFRFTQNLGRWKEISESTCCKGHCDLAQAVLCFLDIHHMAKSPVPDWKGICSKLDGSKQCAQKNIIGCERCQQDTITTIAGKITAPLAQTCKEPPETKCRALAALECKKTLIKFVEQTGGKPTSVLCLKIFEARKCVADLTLECDQSTRLSVNVELETLITSYGGKSCSKDKIVPVCFQTLVDRVTTILSYDPLDRSDPAYKYKPEAQNRTDTSQGSGSKKDSKDKDSKGKDSKGKDSKDKDSKGKDSKDKDSKGKDSKGKDSKGKGSKGNDSKGKPDYAQGKGGKDSKPNSKGSKSKDSSSKDSSGSKPSKPQDLGKKMALPNTYLGKVCREAQLAYTCVSQGLREFPASAVQGLSDVLNTTWKLAWLRCKEYVEPLSCFTCSNATDNALCNTNSSVKCGAGFQMCQTKVENNGKGVVVKIEKKCVVPYECNPGCKGNKCSFCCDTKDCNEPPDGPITGSCNLVAVTGCLSKLSAAMINTSTVNCSVVKQQTACVEYTRKQCESNGKKEVAKTLSGFLASKTVAKCRVEDTDSKCGLYAVTALASGAVSSLESNKTEFCTLLINAEKELAAAKGNNSCGEEETKGVLTSFALLRSQTWALDCSPAIQPLLVCDPLAAYRKCLPQSPADCANLEQKKDCVKNLTAGCQAVQRIFPYQVLRISTALHCPNKTVEVPDPPQDLAPLSSCLQNFSASFNASQVNSSALFAPVDELVTCLITSWDLDDVVNQPPVYKLYINEAFFFLQSVLLPAVTPEAADQVVTVSSQCRESLRLSAVYFSKKVILMLLRPFRSFTSSEDFCQLSRDLEVRIGGYLSGCTAGEKRYQVRLLLKLHRHRLALCPDEDPVPQCSLESATQCLTQFTAYMDFTVDQDGVDVCSALNSSLKCVKSYTFKCDNSKTKLVNKAVFETISVYRSICPKVVSEEVCAMDNSTSGGNPACQTGSTALDKCDSKPAGAMCQSVKEVVACYRDTVGTCTSNADSHKARFQTSFPLQYQLGSALCGLNLTTWSVRGDNCSAPACNESAAASCLVLNDLTNNDRAKAELPRRIREAVSCLKANLSDCDVAVRAHTIYKARRRLAILVKLLPSLATLNLTVEVNFTDPFGDWVPFFVSFIEMLDRSLYKPRWDLLPLCWWLEDFNVFLRGKIGNNLFKTHLLKRASYGINVTLNGVCNDPDQIGGILNLQEIDQEDAACPVKTFMEEAGRSFMETVVTGLLRQGSRKHLCRMLRESQELKLSSCSAGRQRQMKVLVTFFKNVAGEVCRRPRYCNVKRVRRCALQVVATLGGLGVKTSTEQVCSSISVLDACISRYSYRCRESSQLRIRASTYSVRQMAVTVCGKIVPKDPAPICARPDDSACDMKRVLKCSFREFFDLLSAFSNKDAHCRALELTEDCYDRVNKSCTQKSSLFKLAYKLPAKHLAYLRDKWDCSSDSSKPSVCSARCDYKAAMECVTVLSRSLRYWNPVNGDVCSVVTKARQCLLEKTGECKESGRSYFHKHLTSVLTLHSSLTSQCQDVYTCLRSLFTVSRQILSTDDVPDPNPDGKKGGSGSDSKDSADKDKKDGSKGGDSKGKDSKKDGGSKGKDSKGKDSKGGGSKGKDSKGKDSKGKDSKGKGSGSKDSKDKDSKENKGAGGAPGTKGSSSGNSLSFLCQRARQNWQCAQGSLRLLPKSQRELLLHILQPIWTVISERCQNTKQLKCYKCSMVLVQDSLYNGACKNETEICDHHERCSTQYINVDNKKYITRGCMKSAHCHAKDKNKDNKSIMCCDKELCNTNDNINTGTGTTDTCYLEHSVSCALTFAESLMTRGSVDCKTSLTKLECAAKYSATCPSAQVLRVAAGKLLLLLGKTTCLPGSLSPGCSSIAVSSMEAILSNAFSSNFVCSGLNASMASLDHQEKSGKCTASDLVALREVLSYTSVLSYGTCNKDECKSPTSSSQLTPPPPAATTTTPSPPTPKPAQKRQEDCKFHATSLCARDALESLQTVTAANKNSTCSKLKKNAICAVTSLEGCQIPPCLQGLINEVKKQAEDKCGIDFSPPDNTKDDNNNTGKDDQCTPSTVCDVEAAMKCADTLAVAVNDSDLCVKLEKASKCQAVKTKSCRSILSTLTVFHFETTLEKVITKCQGTVTVTLPVPTDVYKDIAVCFRKLFEQVRTAMNSSNFAEPFCSASTNFRACPTVSSHQELGGFLMNDTLKMLSQVASPQNCANGTQNDTATRNKRASCSQEDRATATFSIFLSSMFGFYPLSSRPGLCGRLTKALSVLDEHLSENCKHLGIGAKEIAILQSLRKTGAERMEQFCVRVVYEPSGCKPHLFSLCMKDFNTMSSLAKTTPNTLCRAAESGLKCLVKFSQGCSGGQVSATLHTVRQQVKAIVGNTCPTLTLGLFCPATHPSVTNPATCNPAKAKACLPNSSQLGNSNTLSPNYCSDLQRKLTCAKESVQGCLSSEIKEVQEAVNGIRELPPEINFCKAFSMDIKNYSTACAAQKPCSLKEALACFELKAGEDSADCQVLTKMRSCLDASFQSCPAGAEVTTISYGLFLSTFKSRNLTCTAPFQDLTQTLLQKSDSVCIRTFALSFVSVLKDDRTEVGVCNVLQQYQDCVKVQTENTTRLDSVLTPNSDIAELYKLYCQSGSAVNASTAVVSATCDLHTAASCLLKEFVWVLSRRLLPNVDNRHFCQKWHGQAARQCVSKATGSCAGPLQKLYEEVVKMSNHLVLRSGVCDSLSVCHVQEAYFYINHFSVVVANYTMSKDKTTLCLKKRETETSVASYTAVCNGGTKARTKDSLTQVTKLVDGICEDVVLPPPPICPELPSDQQRCNIGAAFTCVLKFNKELLSQGIPGPFWRSWCSSLESTMQCAAFNTSSCDRKDGSLVSVISALGEVRKMASHHCHWLTADLCTRTTRCPAQDVSCDVKLQMNLLRKPLTDVCVFIKEANSCVERNTLTCTAAQKSVAYTTIKRRLKHLSVPDLKCDNSELAPCLLRAKAASWRVLNKKTGGNDSVACSTMGEAEGCVSTRLGNIAGAPSLQQHTVQNVSQALKAIVDGWCTTPGKLVCGPPLAQVVNTLYDFTISLTSTAAVTNKTLNEVTICTARQTVLTEISEMRKRYANTCGFTELNRVELQLSSGIFSQCIMDTQADCLKAQEAAQKCLAVTTSPSVSCSAVISLWKCIAPAVGLCESGTVQAYSAQFNALLTKVNGTCVRPPIIGLSTLSSTPLYLSEQGGFVDIHFQLAETYALFASNTKRQVRIRAQVSNKNPPTCLEDSSKKISQVSVLYTGNSACGTQLGSGTAWGQKHSIRLVANLDGRQDKLQQASVAVYADIFTYDDANSTYVKSQSFMLTTYDVHIKDTDANAVCSSVGTHTETFDGTTFNNFEAGERVLYRSTSIDVQVIADYKQCTPAATCTCAIKVLAPHANVTFDRCDAIDEVGPPKEVRASLNRSDGKPLDFMVYRHQDLKRYFVVLPTGTIVTVKESSLFLDVWISASTLDYGKTEGLCGLFDMNAYNDLVLPNGETYTLQENDMQYGILSPRKFIEQWKPSDRTYPQGTEVKQSCSCLDSEPANDKCSVLTRVATCDFVQGEDITKLLASADNQGTKKRRKRSAERTARSTNFPRNMTWPTPSNWTEDKAKEHCENLLERTEALKYCARAVLLANGTYPYERFIATCVDDIRLSDSTASGNFTVSQAMESCRSLFLHNTTYQKNEKVRPFVLKFFEHTCENNCNGNGDCKMGVCHCYPSFVGGNCSYQRTSLPRPSNTRVIKNGLCEVSSGSRCEDIFITGQGFVESSYLSCHVQSVQVMSTGFNSPKGLPTKVPATLVTATMAHCQITRSSQAQQTMMVAVSNDGINPTASQLYTAYDPRCYACDPFTHKCRHIATSTCEMKGQCYMPEESSPKDPCLVCDPRKSATKWSVKNAPECEGREDKSDEDKSDDHELSPLLIAILAVGVGLLVVGIIGVAICCVKKRNGRPSSRDDEFGASPPSYNNPGYVSGSMDPQQIFSQGSIHKRAVTRESSYIPSTVQTD